MPIMMNPYDGDNEFKKGMKTAVMFIAEMLELTAEIHKGIDAKQAKEMPDLLLARLCGKIERKK